jgi:tetratricopeptide (TPR) repeat protein
MARKRFDQAVSEFRQALQAEQSAEGYLNLGNALLQEGNSEPALADFREAVRLDPKMVGAYDLWGRALMSQGKPDEAANIYQQTLQHEPDAGVIHYDLALALQQMQRNAEASARVADSGGKTAEAQTDRAQADIFAGQALQHYVKASRTGIDSAEFWTGYGQLLNEAGKFADAETALKRAVTEAPHSAKAHFQLALAESRLGNYAGTIAHYEKVLSLTPDDPQTLNALALVYTFATNSEVRSPKMAVALATRACDATTSQNARFMDTLARAYAADGDFFQAITWEDKAIKRAAQLSDHALTRELQARYELYLDHKAD